MGTHRLEGVGEPQELFGFREEEPAREAASLVASQGDVDDDVRGAARRAKRGGL